MKTNNLLQLLKGHLDFMTHATQSTHLLCSTGAFSRDPDHTGYGAVLKNGPQLPVEGFELMFYSSWYSNIDTIATTLRSSGLRFPAMHSEKNIGTLLGQPDIAARRRGIASFEDNCRLAAALDTHIVVLHLWNWPEMDDHLDYNLSMLSSCYDTAERYGVELAVETIPGRHFDPLTNIQRALEQDARCHFALDTEFLANYHQLDEVFNTSWLWEDNRVHHVHIKDSNGNPFVNGVRRYLHPGEGTIDFAGFFAQLHAKNFSGNLSLESPALVQDGKVDIQQLRTSLDFIHQFQW
jgi:sugar phosphate isomerase/epimerase